jgi:hypothetical protein
MSSSFPTLDFGGKLRAPPLLLLLLSRNSSSILSAKRDIYAIFSVCLHLMSFFYSRIIFPTGKAFVHLAIYEDNDFEKAVSFSCHGPIKYI